MNLQWRGWTPGQWALRLVVLLAPVAALSARGLAHDAPPAWLVVLVVLLAAAWALVPESVVGIIVLLAVGWSWATGTGGGVPPAALAAAAGMLAAHLAALVVGYGPPRLPVPADVARLWAGRGVLLLVPAAVVWLLARLVRELPDSGTAWLAGLALAVSVVLVATVAVRTVTQAEGEE